MPDIDIDTDRRASHADGVCAILQNVGHRHLLFFTGQGECPARHFLSAAIRSRSASRKMGLIAFGLLMLIGRDPRSIRSAARLRQPASHKRNPPFSTLQAKTFPSLIY